MAPSRRRGPSGKTSATAARSAAIQAAEKKRQEEEQGKKNKNHNTNDDDDHETSTAKGVRKKSNDNNATASSATAYSASSQEAALRATKQFLDSQPLCKAVPEDQHYKTICDQRSKCEKMLYKRRQDFEYSEGEYDDGDDDGDDEGCLHCHRKVKNTTRFRIIEDGEEEDDDDNSGEFHGDSNIQVRCDDCRGYICNGCHWCHEFQANHEIRVCDRCDAFYCRTCDEMDQCDDCGEVVCGSCSTLLSCKFCGGGLCEDCATACGRCGIVLCSRDAKFAVDCDTCRLSYCLVCLASGSKDPCVRCGHRPSKRMEQLVHLRLKSIYKAFKSSSSSANTGGSSIGGGGGNHTNNTSHGGRGNTNDNSKKDSNGGRSRRNKPTTLEDMVGDHDDEEDHPTMSMMIGASAGVLPHKVYHDLEQTYLAEQKKADAAAEALLAELEEEETAIAQKKSKKKKKKERKNANKQSKPATKDNSGDNEGDTEAKNKTAQNDIPVIDSTREEANADALSETDSTDEDKKVNYEIDNAHQNAEETKLDPIEKELVECVNNVDLEGIERILFRLKGVPGRAALRKNAKKALKRLKLEQNPPPPSPPKLKAEATTKKDRKLTIPVNRTLSTTGNVASGAASKSSNNEKMTFTSTKAKSSSRKNNATSRCEAQVEIVSRLVGWMIGKNGQRIRDLMEESGAKIWIDQEKIKGQETRNVYISGNRKSVDHAVLLVKDVITNAPPPQGTTNQVAETVSAMANVAISNNISGKTSGVVSPSTIPSLQSGKGEVKSAWAKSLGSARGVDETQGIVPKPPAFISSSEVASSEKNKEGVKPKPAPDVQNVGLAKSEHGLGLLTGVPKPVVDAAIPAVDASNKSDLQSKPLETTTEIVTCDVRFVPLLIGKRGWTIKNIQDDSGARVDIDQTVTPRQVRISGSKENVQKAVTMVRDVLSYPHAQLQSSSECVGDDENVDLSEPGANVQSPVAHVPISTPTKQKLAAASAILENEMIRGIRQEGNGDRVHSPPPVVGDAKTAISASSSLSSTPEPSMASSSKGFIPSHLQNCPPLPPPAEHYILGNPTSQPMARQFLQPERGFVNGMNTGGLWASTAVDPGARPTAAPQMPFAGSSGQIDFQGGRPMAMSHGALSQQQIHIQQQGRHLQMNAARVQEQQNLHGNPNHNPNFIQQSFVANGEILHNSVMQGNPNANPLDRSSQLADQNIGNARNLNSSYNLYGNEGVPSGTIASSSVRGPGFIDSGSRLWNSGNQPYSSSGLQSKTLGLHPPASSGLATTSIGFPSGHHLQGNESGLANPIGFAHSQGVPSQQSHPNTNPLSSTFSGPAPPGLRNDDSRMIDSLFGGGTNVRSSNVDARNVLLPGFNGLSLPTEGGRGNSSGLWGSTKLTETWRNGDSEDPNATSIGNIFSNEVPNRSQDHPQESRFHWD